MVIGTIFAAILGVIVIFLLCSWLLEYLWNITMPEVFNLPKITYWQAFRLMIIGSLLFGGGSGMINFNS